VVSDSSIINRIGLRCSGVYHIFFRSNINPNTKRSSKVCP
jgi:hypothetical protein